MLTALAAAVGIAGAGLVATAPAEARTFVSVGIGGPAYAYPAYGYGYPAYGYPAYGYYPAYYRGYAPVVVGGYYGHGYYGHRGWGHGYYRGGYGYHGGYYRR